MTLYLRGSQTPVQLKATVGDAARFLNFAAFGKETYGGQTRCEGCRGRGCLYVEPIEKPGRVRCPECGGTGRGS
jgi:hypothetical protein